MLVSQSKGRQLLVRHSWWTYFFLREKGCLHNLIFLYFGPSSRESDAQEVRQHISPPFPETRISRWSLRGLSVLRSHTHLSPSQYARLQYTAWHGMTRARPLVIMRGTNPEPPKLRINERSRYATRVCLVYHQPFCWGTIWRSWKSITISVRRQYRRIYVEYAYVHFQMCFFMYIYYVLYMYTTYTVAHT